MNRRSFIAGLAGVLAGVPIVGRLAKSRDRTCSAAPFPATGEGGVGYIDGGASGITVHGPEEIENQGFSKPRSAHLSLRFENVPLRDNLAITGGEVLGRITPFLGTVNRSDWHWREDRVDGYWTYVELARTVMLTDVGVSLPKNGLCRVICAFTAAMAQTPYPSSPRLVDFETEILKALEGKHDETTF